MCYVVYLSTTFAEDLGTPGGGLFNLIPVDDDDAEEAIDLLSFPNRWYLESKHGGCSCHFRHWCEVNGDEFGPPEEWFPEDMEDVEATQAFYDLVSGLVSGGHFVDLVDAWSMTPKEKIRTLDVSLSEVKREAFRFFENARFVIRP